MGPGHEVVDAALGMPGDDALENVGEPGVRLDAVELRRADQGGDDRPVLGAAVRPGEEGVLAGQGDGSDGALDGVGIELDAAVVEEPDEAVPELERVADGLGKAGAAWQSGLLRLQPGAQSLDEGSGAGVARGAAALGVEAADLGLHGVAFGDAPQRLLGDRGVPDLGDVVEAPPDVAPAEGARDGTARPVGRGEAAAGGVAVHLERSGEAFDEIGRVLVPPTVGAEEGDGGRIDPAPRTIVARQRPEPAGLRAATARIRRRRPGLVGEELRGALEGLHQPGMDGTQLPRGVADPVGERGAVEAHALAGEDLRLAMQWQMIGEPGDQDVGVNACGT